MTTAGALERSWPRRFGGRAAAGAVLLATASAQSTLFARAEEIAVALDADDLAAARDLLGRHLVSRPTDDLRADELDRLTLELGAILDAVSKVAELDLADKRFTTLRNFAKQLAKKFPHFVEESARRAERYAHGYWMGGTLFEELGFYYVGPIDGHNLDHLLPVLRNVRDANNGPILVHVVTQKGKGYAPAEASADKYHGVQKFDVVTGEQVKAPAKTPAYQNVFGETLAKLADSDPTICAITAAMPSGTGVDKFAKAHPDRSFDVGIAEQHAVTFAAGLAAQGMRPFCAIYSTFLQRAYDQVVHDVAIQNLPVRFAIDRAGLVGADGATHAGSFDVTYLATLPNMVVMAAADEAELVHMTHAAALHDSGPIAVRYPRGSGTGATLEPLASYGY